MRCVIYPSWASSSSREVLSLKAMMAKIAVGSHCKGRYRICGGAPAPSWLWSALGCMLSCLISLCKCLRFLPVPFWYPVKDAWWMRDQALKLQILAWSTESIDSSQLLGRAVAAGNFCHYDFCHSPVLPFWDLDVLFLLHTTPTILPLLYCYLLPSFAGKTGHLLLFTSKKWMCSLCMQSIHQFN